MPSGVYKRKPFTETHRKKMSIKKTGKRRPDISGNKNGRWKGGISTENEKIRHSLESKLWQDSIKNRDCNCCQKCDDKRVSKLTAHHILNFSSYKELRFAIDNGITLCRDCHKKFHMEYGYKNNTKEQMEKFLELVL